MSFSQRVTGRLKFCGSNPKFKFLDYLSILHFLTFICLTCEWQGNTNKYLSTAPRGNPLQNCCSNKVGGGLHFRFVFLHYFFKQEIAFPLQTVFAYLPPQTNNKKRGKKKPGNQLAAQKYNGPISPAPTIIDFLHFFSILFLNILVHLNSISFSCEMLADLQTEDPVDRNVIIHSHADRDLPMHKSLQMPSLMMFRSNSEPLLWRAISSSRTAR